MRKCSLSNKRLKISSDLGGPEEVAELHGEKGVEFGPVGCRAGWGDQFDRTCLWVNVGHGQAGWGLSRRLGTSRRGEAEPRARRWKRPNCWWGPRWQLLPEASLNFLGPMPSASSLPESPRC